MKRDCLGALACQNSKHSEVCHETHAQSNRNATFSLGVPPFNVGTRQQSQDNSVSSYSPSRNDGRPKSATASGVSPPPGRPQNLITGSRGRDDSYNRDTVKDGESPYDLVRSSNANGGGPGSDRDRRTPASDKDIGGGHRRTPQGEPFDQRSRHTPSPAPTPGSSASAPTPKAFPSDSTTDVRSGPGGGPPEGPEGGLGLLSRYAGGHDSRVRRHSDAGSEGDVHDNRGGPGPLPVAKYNDFRGSRDELRGQSPPRNGTNIHMKL